MAGEQGALAQKREAAAAAGGSSGGSGSGTGSGPSGDEKTAAASGAESNSSTGSTAGKGAPPVVAGGGAPNASNLPRYPAPDGTPDGGDDDVVAKQLREAAETEKDPQLRAKLWDEYRRYKGRKS